MRSGSKDQLGVVLDAGAFIAVERRNREIVRLVRRFEEEKVPLVTSAGVVAQVWRGGVRDQVPVVFLLRKTDVLDLTYRVARAIGSLLGRRGTSDPVDAHLVILAQERGWPILTSDPDDLRVLDPRVVIDEI